MQPWEKLGQTFRNSNLMQATAMIGLLERADFVIEPANGKIQPLKLSSEEIDALAEMEHGRWNVERLQDRWRPGEVRDTPNKIHPCLVTWDKLPDDIRKWDRNAVANWPKLLAGAGLRVTRKH